MKAQSLQVLLAEANPLSLVPDVTVKGISVDSRLVQPGDLYFAIVDGVDRYEFMEEVIKRGAVAVVGAKEDVELTIPYIRVEDDRTALAQVSAAFFGYPARELTLIGVTGTDGKTTTANFIYQILQAAGLPSGMITTVNAQIGDQILDTGFHVTTPEAFDSQRYLRQMVDAGLSHAVIEMTSIGLAQQRGAQPREFDVAVITNVTHEHVREHGSFAAYFDAKALLFEGLAEPYEKAQPIEKLAVLNRDDSSYEELAERTKVRQISYGLNPEADFSAVDVEHTLQGLRFTAKGNGLEIPVECNLIGDYNVSNALAALTATVFGISIDPHAAQKGIAALQSIPGRMEVIDLGQDFTAIVDFAHTPNGLENALKAARQMTDKRVIAVFGSAGLRDQKKRRIMAEVSAQLADISVFTAEDPRTESLDDILSEMAAGAKKKGAVKGESFWKVPDRGAAISFALLQAKPGDLVIVLGKGHEQSMCFEETEYPWDDRTALRAALAGYLGVEGPKMPYLPTQDAA